MNFGVFYQFFFFYIKIGGLIYQPLKKKMVTITIIVKMI